jgi:hypothetical protein
MSVIEKACVRMNEYFISFIMLNWFARKEYAIYVTYFYSMPNKIGVGSHQFYVTKKNMTSSLITQIRRSVAEQNELEDSKIVILDWKYVDD